MSTKQLNQNKKLMVKINKNLTLIRKYEMKIQHNIAQAEEERTTNCLIFLMISIIIKKIKKG